MTTSIQGNNGFLHTSGDFGVAGGKNKNGDKGGLAFGPGGGIAGGVKENGDKGGLVIGPKFFAAGAETCEGSAGILISKEGGGFVRKDKEGNEVSSFKMNGKGAFQSNINTESGLSIQGSGTWGKGFSGTITTAEGNTYNINF